MPVSRGRKPKKKQKPRKPPLSYPAEPDFPGYPFTESLGTLPGLADLAGSRKRPGWFDSSIDRLLAGAAPVVQCATPDELQGAVARLTGAELHRVLNSEASGMWFEWWFEDLAREAASRVRAVVSSDGDGDGDWRVPWRLLHGLAAIGSPALRAIALTARHAAAKVLTPAQRAAEPAWLALCPDAAATGELSVMRDDYGTRLAVLAGCEYPGGAYPSVYLFDFDVCGSPSLAGGGGYGSTEQAADAWRSARGDLAASARPERVTSDEQLACLTKTNIGSGFFRGDESRAVMDNYFLANRRVHDIAAALGKLPDTGKADRLRAVRTAVRAFTAWYLARNGTEPHQEAVEWLAGDWLETALPGTERNVSPHRVHWLVRYMDDDWLPKEPATIAARALLPDWVRWNGEEAGTRAELIERSAAVAAGQPWDRDECPGFTF